ncbi:hypothetical protein QJQ45_014888 [Haematococcus lacustris]|nr:hypothetical protein QJQ45_014888 [Haematococcus lacustris]
MIRSVFPVNTNTNTNDTLREEERTNGNPVGSLAFLVACAAGFDKDSVVDHQLKEGLAGKPVMPLLLVDHMAFTNFKVTGEKEDFEELMASNHNALMLQFREVLLKECEAFCWENIDNVRVCGMQGQHSEAEMQRACQSVISAELNPLFRVARVLLLPALPRNASNKVMRRLLRDQAGLQAKEQQGRQPGHVLQTLPVAGEGEILLKAEQAATFVSVVIGRTSPPAGSTLTDSSPESLDCDCEGVTGGRECNGKCGDTYFGSGFVRWISGKRCGTLPYHAPCACNTPCTQKAVSKLSCPRLLPSAVFVFNLRFICCLPHCMPRLSRHCFDLGGKPLPQIVSKLHQMVRQLQNDHSQQQERMSLNLQAAEQQATSLARAKHDADRKLKEAQTSSQQMKEQYQASQKKLVEQHLQYKRQALAEVEELRRQSTTAQVSAKQEGSKKERAHARQLSAEVEALQKASLRHVEEVETLEERLSTSNAQEEAAAADLRLCKEELASAQSQLAQLNSSSSSSSAGPAGGGEGAQAQQGPYTAQRCAGGSFPVGFGSVEQRECLDQLSIATEQLAAALVHGNNLQYPAVQDMLEAAKESLEGTASLVSSWDRDSCAAALHHHVLNTALDIAQQRVDWYADSFVACLTSCPESGRTELHAVLQQLQQAKSSTLFLVAQQQAPSHPATWKAFEYIKDIRQCMQRQLEQQLGLGSDKQACQVWQPQLVAVAAAMTRVNLLLASLQSSCPGLQLVSKLEEQVAQEGQGACDAPVRQLLGKVDESRPLFLVRPGLVCAAAGGGRQVLVRQQAVALVPDPEWLEQLQWLEAEAARKQQEAEAARKQQKERVRLENEQEHRRQQEAQRLLKAKEEQQQKEAEAARKQQKEREWVEAQEEAYKCLLQEQGVLKETSEEREKKLLTEEAVLKSHKELIPGGGAGRPGPDTQDTRLDSSAWGSDVQCSDAASQAGRGQGHETNVPHHQTSAPDQGQLVAAATLLLPGQVNGGQGDANAPSQQLAVVGSALVPSQEKSRLHGGATSTSRPAAQQHGARQHEGLETAAPQPPPCSLTECGAVQQPPTHLPQTPPTATQQQPPPPPLQQQSSSAYFPSHALQPPGSYQSNGSGHQAPDSSAQGLVPDSGREGQPEAAASRGSGGQAAATGTEGSASGEAGGSTLMEVEERHEADGYSMPTPPASMEMDAGGEEMVEQSVDLMGNPLPRSVLQMHQLYIGLQLEAREYMEDLDYRHQQNQRRLQDQCQRYKRSLEAAEKATESYATSFAQARKQLRALQDQAKADKASDTRAAVARLAAELQALRQAMECRDEEVQVLEERLSAACSGEEGVLANMRSIKCTHTYTLHWCCRQEELTAAQSQLAQLIGSSSSPGPGSGGEGAQAQQGPHTGQRCAGGSFPVGFGSVEQRECLDQLSIATEQLTAVLGQSDNLKYPAVQDMLKAAKESLEGAANLVSSWDRDSCVAALHHRMLNTALDIAQQQVDWHADSFVSCLTSCPEAGRTKLHAVLQQLQQAKSSTLFLVAQQQAPSHPATWEASQYIKNIRQYMQEHLEQQLGLGSDKQACQVWRPELVAVAAAMTRVNLLLASLQSSCPGLQLVSRLEECGAQEGQQACEAPVRQLLGRVEASLPLFLVRPGLVCAAAGGGRQVLVRQQAVELVPDPAWLEQQQLEAEARKQQEERERLEAEMKHRRKQEAQRLLEEERLTKEEQQQKQQEEEKGWLAQTCKEEQVQQQRSKWLEASPGFLGACAQGYTIQGSCSLLYSQDLSPGCAGCPGPDKQDTGLDSSAQGGDVMCSDADSQELSADLAVQPLLQTVDRVQQLVADLHETLNRNVVAKERSEQEWDRAQAALAILTEKMQDLEWELLERTETVQGLEKQLAEADAKKERALAEMGRVKSQPPQLNSANTPLESKKSKPADGHNHFWCLQARVTQLTTEVSAMQAGRAQLVEQVEVLGERLASRAAQEEEPAAELRLSKELLQAAEAQLAQLGNDSSAGLDSSSGGGKVHLYTAQRCAGGSFPVGFSSVEQRECLDQLSVAAEQLAAVLLKGISVQSSLEQDMLKAAKQSLEVTASLVSSWNRDSCAAALHHHVLNTALDIAQQQEDWYQHTAGAELTKYLACLTSCPEAGRTDLHGAMQQVQQAKSSTLFLVAQQQAPSHPATWKAS